MADEALFIRGGPGQTHTEFDHASRSAFIAGREVRLTAREQARTNAVGRFFGPNTPKRQRWQPRPAAFGLPTYAQVGVLASAAREGGDEVLARGLFGFGDAGQVPPRGILPQSEWGKADAAVAAARALGQKLAAGVEAKWFVPGIGAGKEHYVGLYKTFQKNVERLAEILQKMKTDPTFGRADPVAKVQWWVDEMRDLDRWAKQIDQSADFGSAWGMIKDVGVATALDVGRGVQAAGNALIDAGKGGLTIVKWAPWIALIGGGLLLYLWGRKLVAPAGEALRTVAGATADRIRGGMPPPPLFGHQPRRKRRAKRKARR